MSNFQEQLDMYLHGQLKTNVMLSLTNDATKLNVPTATAKPLIIKQSTLLKIWNKHSLPIEYLIELPKLIKNHPLAMQSVTQNNSIVVCLNLKNNNKDNIIAPINLSKTYNLIEVSEVSSVHARDIQILINKTISGNKEIYLNEKTKSWLASNGLQLPALSQDKNNYIINSQNNQTNDPIKTVQSGGTIPGMANHQGNPDAKQAPVIGPGSVPFSKTNNKSPNISNNNKGMKL
jgi:hypothetical protein